MKRTRRECGMICLGLAGDFMLGEVKQVFQPNNVVAWVLALLTLGCLMLGFYLVRKPGKGG